MSTPLQHNGSTLALSIQIEAPGVGAAQRRIDWLHPMVLSLAAFRPVMYLPEAQLWSDGIEVVQDVVLLLLFAWALRLIKRDLAQPIRLSAQGDLNAQGEA